MNSQAEIRCMEIFRRKEIEAQLAEMGLTPIPQLHPDEKIRDRVTLKINGEERPAKVVYWRRGKEVLNITEANGNVLIQVPFYYVSIPPKYHVEYGVVTKKKHQAVKVILELDCPVRKRKQRKS